MVAVPSSGRASLVEPQPLAPEASVTHGLYERHAAKIQSYCRQQLGSREEAEDAVQTTFMNAFRALGKGVVPEAEAAWLYKIAENVCLSRRRSSWRRNRIESPADFEVIEEIVAGPTRQRDELIGIEDALAAMPDQQRRAILLREWQGLSYREISAELELSQSAVEALIFRARRSLAQGLTEPDSVKPRATTPRKRLRHTLHLVDLTTLLAGAKSLLMGAAALKATTAAVVVAAAAGTAVTVSSDRADPPSKPPLAVSPDPLLPPAAPTAAAAAGTRSVAPAVSAAASVDPGARGRKLGPVQAAKLVSPRKQAGAKPDRSAGKRTDRPPAASPAEPRGAADAPRRERTQRPVQKADVNTLRQAQLPEKSAPRAEREQVARSAAAVVAASGPTATRKPKAAARRVGKARDEAVREARIPLSSVGSRAQPAGKSKLGRD